MTTLIKNEFKRIRLTTPVANGTQSIRLTTLIKNDFECIRLSTPVANRTQSIRLAVLIDICLHLTRVASLAKAPLNSYLVRPLLLASSRHCGISSSRCKGHAVQPLPLNCTDACCLSEVMLVTCPTLPIIPKFEP